MSNAVIEKFRTERDQVIAQAEAMVERDDFTPDDEGYQALKERAATLNKTLEDLGQFQATKSAADSLDATLARASRKADVAEKVRERTSESFGEMFTRSDQFADYNGYGRMQAVTLDGFLDRAVHLTSDFDLPSTVREKDWNPVRTPIQDACSIIPVTTGSVDVVTYALTNAADVVAEGAAKPESGLAQTVTPVTLDTIAHWMQFSRQLAQDGPAVARKVDQGLRRGVLLKLEAEASAAVNGGTYNNVVDADLLTAVRIAMGELQDAGYNPDTLFLNPADWAALDVAIQGGRTDGGTGQVQSSYWGLSVVSDSGVSAGTSIVADARTAFEVYRRTGVETFLTDSHASLFTSNILVLLAEARQKTVVVDPNAARTTSAA